MGVGQQPVLRIEGVHFHFDTRPVFSDFSAAIEPGITWLRGANGMGKTTLLKLVAGTLTPNRGTIALGGVDCAAQPLAYRLATFYCGGDLPDLPWLTVQEFLDLHLALYPDTEARLVERQLEAFGVTGTLEQALSTLSLGQHKKVQLSLALALPVRLLLLDEPFNGLDAAAVEYLRGQLGERGARQDMCVLLTSHLEPLVEVKRMLDLDR
ncbi:ABC transporter ATP-binding protein [Massilia violaceinigra]|uniref:ABC transporter ATP-binding protein n=1 Tax=Massilia violaceinigra TaxID=2045208 RepID=A0A2D2DDW9_9BURK|nr:ATP-binding cassette domain-containing protein [Massilia violaceinigra]ATQ73181.1 ABC transporter ATP-binding protein [Massilia violaceinigra]